MNRAVVDSLKLVKQLQSNSTQFTRTQAIALLNTIQHHTLPAFAHTHSHNISAQEADHEEFSYKVALYDLKTELETLRKTETHALQSSSMSIQRDLDIVSLKFR